MAKTRKENVHQVWQIWDDNGDMFLMGTYKTPKRAKEEIDFMEAQEMKYPVQYVIRMEKVIS